MPGSPISFRRASEYDASALAWGVLDGVESYPAFAPADWTAPSLHDEIAHLRTALTDPTVHCLIAESEGEVVGQITVAPAARAPHPVSDPSLGHLSNLFVRRDHWGGGLAGDLHRAALEAAKQQGLTDLRLFVAAGQARARRFYEREGWAQAGEPWDDPVPGLTMVEYRRAVAD